MNASLSILDLFISYDRSYLAVGVGVGEELVEDVEVPLIWLLRDDSGLLEEVSLHVRTRDLPIRTEVDADELTKSENEIKKDCTLL